MNETRSGGATGTLTGVALRTDIGAEIFPTAEPSCAATSSSHSMVNHSLKHEVVVTYSGSRAYRVIAGSYCAQCSTWNTSISTVRDRCWRPPPSAGRLQHLS